MVGIRGFGEEPATDPMDVGHPAISIYGLAA
jgi:hypothetical protein